MKSRSFSDLTWSIISRTLCFELFSWFSMSISSDSGIFVSVCSIFMILPSILFPSLLTSSSRSSINVSLVLSNFWWPKGHYNVPLSVKCQQSRQSVSAQFRFWRSLPANQSYLCVVHQVACQTFDSSVGRAVDCSCTLSDIHRSLVQIRLEGVFVLDQLLQSHLLCVSSIIVESCKMPG